MTSSAAFESEFKHAVIAHLKSKVDYATWESFREIAINGVIESPIEGSENWTREHLVEQGVAIGSGSVAEILDAFATSTIVTIGTIEGEPIYFVKEQGIYVWGTSKESNDALELWISCPAYPPGW